MELAVFICVLEYTNPNNGGNGTTTDWKGTLKEPSGMILMFCILLIYVAQVYTFVSLSAMFQIFLFHCI